MSRLTLFASGRTGMSALSRKRNDTDAADSREAPGSSGRAVGKLLPVFRLTEIPGYRKIVRPCGSRSFAGRLAFGFVLTPGKCTSLWEGGRTYRRLGESVAWHSNCNAPSASNFSASRTNTTARSSHVPSAGKGWGFPRPKRCRRRRSLPTRSSAGESHTTRSSRFSAGAEWEKAAAWDMERKHHRAYPWGDDFDPRRANHCYQLGCRCNSDSEAHRLWWEGWSPSEEGKRIRALGGGTVPVGKFQGDKSFFGCLDMAGNVQEWVNDWWRDDYYKIGPKENPLGPTEDEADDVVSRSSGRRIGRCRAVRGGRWALLPRFLRASVRIPYGPATRTCYVGFRCAADCPWKPQQRADKDVRPVGGEQRTHPLSARACKMTGKIETLPDSREGARL